MVRKQSVNTHDITMGQATLTLGIYGSAALMPDGSPNPLLDASDPNYQANKQEAKRQGREKAAFIRAIGQLVCNGGWRTLQDIGVTEVTYILIDKHSI